MKTGRSGAECPEGEKKNHPVEVIDDVLEQVSGGISDVELDPEGVYGNIDPGEYVMALQPAILREGNYGTETEKIV